NTIINSDNETLCPCGGGPLRADAWRPARPRYLGGKAYMSMFSNYDQRLLDHVTKLHFIGCGGSGMFPLIQILAVKGWQITGSDVLDGSIIQAERAMGIRVTLGHDANNIVGADMVVYSAAISKDNVELAAAESYGIPTVERSVLLGYVSRLYKSSIC